MDKLEHKRSKIRRGHEFVTMMIDDSQDTQKLSKLDIAMLSIYCTAKVYRELQVLYREIGLQGSHIYRDLSCVILLVIIRLILYKIKGIIGKS